MTIEVRDNPELRRYEARAGGHVVGVALYELRDGRIVFTHTEVSPGAEGGGVGSTLVREALDDASRRALPSDEDERTIDG